MSTTTYINKPILTARDAIASHVRWKITLLLAIRMREPLSSRATHSIQNPAECSIRQWLLSSHTQNLRGTPEHAAVLDRHQQFHIEMQHIATLINDAQYEAAEILLNAPGFQKASNAVANALMCLGRLSSAKFSLK